MPEQQKNNGLRDVAIIGAGPVGLFAVFECGMVGLTCHVIDALPEIGGQCSALYPEKPIYDIPAYPEIAAADLIAQLEKQAQAFDPAYHLNQQVVSISNNNGLWHLKTSSDAEITAKAIIIAGGAGAFGPNKPPLEGIESYENTSVFYMVRQKSAFSGKNIVIAGGGDSAVDWALSMAPIAKSVQLVHRRDKFRAAPESIKKLHDLVDKGALELVTPYQLKSLGGENGQLTSVTVADMQGNEKTLQADILLPFYGLAMELGPIAEWGLNLDHHHISVHPTTCQTNREMIYAIGDIAAYENKLKLILTGFSEAAFAAHDIYKKLHPETPLHFEYSTTKGKPAL
ncbi:MAG: NAD(P)/FAD-dependent oxidoreductase [Alphaproteobacteria bacterium]|nr:NAD(P)/FAD-dependent oxidoreductase [Alphaproteobacteria bacterium]